jgi:hypothetical protein
MIYIFGSVYCRAIGITNVDRRGPGSWGSYLAVIGYGARLGLGLVFHSLNAQNIHITVQVPTKRC